MERENMTEYALLVGALEKMRVNQALRNKMREVPRFERYFTGGGAKNRDMNEIGHALNTLIIVKNIGKYDLENGNISQTQFDRLRAAALIHDLGEIETGDISYDQKNEKHEAEEKRAFQEKIKYYFPEITNDELATVLDVYTKIAQNKDKSNSEARYFNMIERLGYLTTAIEEFERKPENVDWQWLCGNVMHNQGKHLAIFISAYESAKQYISKKIDTIEKMLKYLKTHREESRDMTDEDFGVWEQMLKTIDSNITDK